jgi:hypothetical protein
MGVDGGRGHIEHQRQCVPDVSRGHSGEAAAGWEERTGIHTVGCRVIGVEDKADDGRGEEHETEGGRRQSTQREGLGKHRGCKEAGPGKGHTEQHQHEDSQQTVFRAATARQEQVEAERGDGQQDDDEPEGGANGCEDGWYVRPPPEIAAVVAVTVRMAEM